MLTKWKLWVIGALAAALLFAFWQWRAEIRNAAQWAVGFDQLQETIAELESEAERQREAARARERRAVETERALEELRRESARREEFYRDLEREDPEYRDWSRQRLPSAYIDRMRGSADGGGED